jgi:uncharacterized membrane protein YhaH (DUF805 family)
MDFQQAVKTCLKKYAEFGGRASRSEYWWFILAMFVLQIVVSVILGDIVALLVNLALLLPQLAAGTRRLHDMGKSGWFQLLWFIPLLGWGVMIYFLVQPSAGPNQYGEGPALPADVALPPPGAA